MTSTRTVSRVGWPELDRRLRQAIEAELGAEVAQWVNQEEGFSPGLAARCLLSDNRRVFIKALPGQLLKVGGRFYRHEIAVMKSMPATAPVPRLLGYVEEPFGLALVLEDIDGRLPKQPWSPGDLRAAIDAIDNLDLPPTPEAHDMTQSFVETFSGWRNLVAEQPTDIEPWLDPATLQHLVDIESRWVGYCPPEALIHADIRADNVLLATTNRMSRDSADNSVWLVDWANACNGPAWLDVAAMIPSVVMGGGWEPEEVWALSTHSDTADPDAVTTVAVAVAGYFTAAARQPPIPAIPMLRDFQEAQGKPARAWVKQRLGL